MDEAVIWIKAVTDAFIPRSCIISHYFSGLQHLTQQYFSPQEPTNYEKNCSQFFQGQIDQVMNSYSHHIGMNRKPKRTRLRIAMNMRKFEGWRNFYKVNDEGNDDGTNTCFTPSSSSILGNVDKKFAFYSYLRYLGPIQLNYFGF